MLFSVVIPAYNARDSIKRTIESLEKQSCKDFEVVFVDDGSSDDTLAVISSLRSALKETTVIHQQNAGVFQARRTGASMCKGDYILFLDADDQLRQDALLLLAEAIQSSHADIISFCYTRNQDFSKDKFIAAPLSNGLYDDTKMELVKHQLCRGHLNSIWSNAIRKTLFRSTPEYTKPHRISFGEDLLQMIDLINACNSFYQLDDALYYYYDSNQSAQTSSFSITQLPDIDYVTTHLIEYASTWGRSFQLEACCSRIEQFLYLAQINELSDTNPAEKKSNYHKLHQFMSEHGVFKNAPLRMLRIDNLFVFIALKVKFWCLSSTVIRMREAVKRFLA